MSHCLLTLIATPDLEERLVDWLLGEGYQGFTSLPCNGHGTGHEGLSTAEKVAGRQRQVAFWLQLEETVATDLVRALSESFGATELHYWIVPVLSGGPIGRGSNLAQTE